VLVRAGAAAWSSADAGQTWRETIVGDTPTAAEPGDLLRAGDPTGAACAGGRVEAWAPDFAPRGPLERQPGLDTCQVVPAWNSAWWVGGAADGWAAVAVTHDRGGTWLRRTLPVHGSARVAVLGPHVYALVTDGAGRLSQVFHSADRGATFEATGLNRLPAGVVGDPVPLLDGRLLIVDPPGRWQFSADDGRTFRQAGGNLPAVGRLARTGPGWIAYDLFHSGWAAFSTDGATWRKLELR
jgi:hypothetical protein